jgi:lysyl endopeptidase
MPTIDRPTTKSVSWLRAACAAAGLALALAGGIAHARQGEPPYSFLHPAKAGLAIPVEELPAIDAAMMRAQADETSNVPGSHPKRLRVANDNPVSINANRDGVWESMPDGSRLWRVRVRVAGATDLRLRFTRFSLPDGATLHIIGADHYYQGPYSVADATDSRFNSPVVPGDEATVELHVPAGVPIAADGLELTRVGAGFRDLFQRGKLDPGPGASGACNVNVACPLGQAYPDEVAAAAYYEFDDDDDRNSYLCSGTLLADVPRDHRNYFLSAAHCVDSDTEAASMVIYWNYQSTQCNALVAPAGGFLNDDLHGASLRATRADVDFSLVELNQPPDPSWNAYYAGWDASGIAPAGTVGIHHPNGDVKKITAGPSPSTTYSCISASGSATTHWQTGPYTQGTTEGGSSGSGLFASAASGTHARLLIGTLSGGEAACSITSPSQPNASTDCYGRFAVAWNGTAAATRLRDWLDPANTGTVLLQGGDPPPLVPRAHSTRPIPAALLQAHERR